MPFNREPAKLEQVAPRLFVTKHPGVHTIKMKPAPVFAVPPVFWLLGVHASGVAVCFVEHPAIQLAKDFLGHSRAKVVRPSPNDRVEFREDRLNIASLSFVPLVLELLMYFLDGLLAGFN